MIVKPRPVFTLLICFETWNVPHHWQSVKNTKLSYKGVKIKNLKVDKPKARFQLLAPQQTKKAYNKTRKKKKKDCRNYGQDRGQGRKAQKGSILALKANTINLLAN